VTFIDPPFMTFGLSILMRKGDVTSNIRNMIDLGGQDRIKYGVVSGGSTAIFFEDPDQTDEYHDMWSAMVQDRNGSLLNRVEDGVRRVRESTDSDPFAFIGEKYMVEFHASRAPCDLKAVDGSVEDYNGEYHLAVNRNLDDATTTQLSNALQQLKDSGRLDELYNKWWTQRNQCSGAPAASATSCQ